MCKEDSLNVRRGHLTKISYCFFEVKSTDQVFITHHAPNKYNKRDKLRFLP